MGGVKLEDCPLCGKEPDTIQGGGLIVTGCLNTKHERNGQPGRTVTDSKRKWNSYARQTKATRKGK